MDFSEFSFLKLGIWRQSEKEIEEIGTLDRSRCALEKFSGIEQEKDQNRKGASRENSGNIATK